MSRRALMVVAFAVGMVGWGAGRAAARGTLMSDQNAVSGGGAPAVCSAGTPNNVMVIGSGPSCSQTSRLTVDGTRTQFTGVMNPDSESSYFSVYARSLYAWFWDTSSTVGWYANMDSSQNLRLIRRNSGDRVALTMDTTNGNFAVGNVGGQYSVPELLSVGNTSQFRVNSSGDITRINDVQYSFPSAQGSASTVLTNDGAGNLSWSAGGGGGSAQYQGALTVYVDAVHGQDTPNRGTLAKPYQTIQYAYSQVASLGAPANTVYTPGVAQWLTEKLVIRIAPGRYVENVTLGFKRARVQLLGVGVQLVGNLTLSAQQADFPASNLEALKASFPAPWTGQSAQITFEVSGEAGGGVEADASGLPFVVTGLTTVLWNEPTWPGFGLVIPNWENNYGIAYAYANKALLIGGFVVATRYTVPETRGLPTMVMEIDSSTIGNAGDPARTYLGAVPYAYLASPSSWTVANVGSTNKTAAGTLTLKANNSTLAAALGANLTVGEIDGCRLYDLDRSMLGTVDNGSLLGSTSSSYVGLVSNQFRVYSGGGVPASVYRLGSASAATRYKLDSTSYTTLAFSRSSGGVLSARTLDLGAGVSFDFQDEARSLAYSGNAAVWAAPAPVTVAAALDRLAVVVRALNGGVGP